MYSTWKNNFIRLVIKPYRITIFDHTIVNIKRIRHSKLNDVDNIQYYNDGIVWWFNYYHTDIVYKSISFYFYKTGNPSTIFCWANNKRNPISKGGPSVIDYHPNGVVSRKLYWVEDVRHRSDGPAYVSYNENGEIVLERFFLNDIEYTKDEFLEKRIH